jgi:multidrug transporter EmrE-like cation transporter
MVWLILCILSSTGIFVTFKFIDKTKTPLINAIVVNYIIASVFGFVLTGGFPVKEIVAADWFLSSVFIGILFIVMFVIIGLSSAIVGISITTVASKMSVVLPMLFAIFAYNEQLGYVKAISIAVAVLAVFMSVYKKPQKTAKINYLIVVLPIILFFGMGTVDSLVIYSKETYVDDNTASVFSATLFGFALLSGVIYTLFRPTDLKNFSNKKSWFFGSILGIANFGSIYLMIRALNSGVFENSVVYGITNIGIVTLSVIIGTAFFKEKLTKLNIIGVVLSVLAIIMLTLADL